MPPGGRLAADGGTLMFARYSFLTGDPARVDDVLAYARDTVLPTVKKQPGNYGLGAWADRASGRILVGTVWADRASLEASEPAVTQQRSTAAAMAGTTASVEVLEVLLVDAGPEQHAGNVTRVLTVSSDPARLDAQLAWGREQMIPALRAVDGYLAYVVTADRDTGKGRVSVTYRDAASAEAGLQATAELRSQLAGLGLTIEGTELYEVAIVGIDAPVSEVPAPRGPAQERVAP